MNIFKKIKNYFTFTDSQAMNQEDTKEEQKDEQKEYIFCPECNAMNSDYRTHCIRCGHYLKDTSDLDTQNYKNDCDTGGRIIQETYENFIDEGGNFTLIARNIATTYCVIRNSYLGANLNEKQKLYATGLCNAFGYLQKGEIEPEEIQDSVSYAMTGKIGGFLYNVTHSSPIVEITEYSQQDRYIFNVFGLAMQLELLYFVIDTDINSKYIISSLIDNKQLIKKTVEMACHNPKSNRYYNEIFGSVNFMLNDPDFLKIVKAF